MIYKPYKHLPPFKGMVLQNFPFIEEDFDAITNYQLLCKIVEYLKNVIHNENIMEENINNLYDEFVNLKNYVDNYFDNLDVQEEINNKLDEMAENGELAEIIENTVFKNLTYEKMSVLFPKSQGVVKSGDCILIKVNDKSILIDTHRVEAKDGIESFLDRNNITNLDYVILTHYHDDHVGNFVSLITDGYINENSFVYLPAYSSLIDNSQTLLNYYNQVNNAITENNIPHKVPNELEKLIINDFSLTFYNCEQSIFNTYGYTDYNDCSTVCYIEYGNNNLLFTGDINNKPFKRFNDLHYFNKKIKFYKISHHGINYDNAECILFLQRITPNIAVQTCELLDVETNIVSQGSETSVLKHLNCDLYSIYNNLNDLIFNLSYYEISLKQGMSTYSMSNRPIQINIYVDSSTTNIYQTGSQTAPFKDLSECFGKLLNIPNVRYIINMADGDYNDGITNNYQSKLCGFIEVIINGNENDNTKVNIKNSIQIFNGVNLSINNCSLSAFFIKNSYLTLNNCIIDGEETENKTKTLIYSEMSTINLKSNNLTNAQIGISGHNDIIYANSNTFNNLSTAIQNQYGKVQLNNNTYTDVTNKTYLFNNTTNQSENTLNRTLLYSGNVNSGDISLNDDIRKYNMIIATFGAVSSGQLSSGIALPYINNSFDVNSSYLIPFISTVSGETTANLFKFTVKSGGTGLTINTCENQNLRAIWGINLQNKNE